MRAANAPLTIFQDYVYVMVKILLDYFYMLGSISLFFPKPKVSHDSKNRNS